MFREFLNQKSFETNFLFSFPFYPTNIPSIFLSYLILLAIFFFAGPVSSLTQPHIQPTDPIPLVIFKLQTPAAALLFVVSSAFGIVEPPHLLPLFPSENDRTPSPPFPRFHLP
jgi:hypothetical protein